METLPRISVVVPSFNQGVYLRDTFASLFRQGYPHLEVVVMDGGSTDDSVAIIREHEPRLAYWQSQRDGGQSAAINAGVRRCTGDLVTWLNSDDYYWGASLWTVARAWQAHLGFGLYIGNGLRYVQSKRRYLPFTTRHLALDRTALVRGVDFILQPATFFLKKAWDDAGGLDPALRFCMDWDMYIRISQRWPAVLINDFLAVSREYEETKTRSGRMERAFEIVRMVGRHAGREATPGSLLYLLETASDVSKGRPPRDLGEHLRAAIISLAQQLGRDHGGGHVFPERSGPQDRVYLPLATTPSNPVSRPLDAAVSWPTISIIIPALDHPHLLARTVESVLNQDYPHLESFVTGLPAKGGVNPARAVNRGLSQATGDVLGWVGAGDLLTPDALREVGQAFADDPELDLVFGNAVYVDAEDRPYLEDYEHHRSGFWYGDLKAPELPAAYWSGAYALAQPTVFFRRRLLERCGGLDESFHFIHDFELFTRFLGKAKVRKLERTQALCRVVPEADARRRVGRLAELYRWSRRRWPSAGSLEFRDVLLGFLGHALRRKFGRRRGPHFWATAGLVGCCALTGIGNAEWLLELLAPSRVTGPRHLRLPPPRLAAAPPPSPHSPADVRLEPAGPQTLTPALDAAGRRFRSVYCSTLWPGAAPRPPAEEREAHLLRLLASLSTIEFFALGRVPPGEPAVALDAVHTAETIAAARPDLVNVALLRRSLRGRVVAALRRWRLPVPGPRQPGPVADQLPRLHTFFQRAVQETLDHGRPDFVFVSPQDNALPLALATNNREPRLVLVAHEVEAERAAGQQRGLARLALAWEADRTAAFERQNLARFDAVLAASAADRRWFIDHHGFEAERVLVVSPGEDAAGLGAWLEVLAALPHRGAGVPTPPPFGRGARPPRPLAA